MKRIFLFLMMAMFLTGCGTLNTVRDRIVIKSFYDYSAYTNEGFFLSPNQYVGEHQPIGELLIEVAPAIVPIKSTKSPENPQKKVFSNGIYSNQSSHARTTIEKIEPRELLEMAVSEAVRRGPNGISNFDVKAVYTTSVTKYGTHTSLSHYEISGLCIRIHSNRGRE